MLYGMDLIDAIRSERADPPAGIRTLGLDVTHRWIRAIHPGACSLDWQVDEAHTNLEGAVICSWTVALADQALFFASNTLCSVGEATRTTALHLDCVRNIVGGTVAIEAKIVGREGDDLTGRCDFTDEQGELLATVTARIQILR